MGEIKTEIKTQDFIPETSGSLKGQWNEVVPGAAAARCYTTREVSALELVQGPRLVRRFLLFLENQLAVSLKEDGKQSLSVSSEPASGALARGASRTSASLKWRF